MSHCTKSIQFLFKSRLKAFKIDQNRRIIYFDLSMIASFKFRKLFHKVLVTVQAYSTIRSNDVVNLNN